MIRREFEDIYLPQTGGSLRMTTEGPVIFVKRYDSIFPAKDAKPDQSFTITVRDSSWTL